MIFPAVSPRIHIRLQYVNEIRGFWIADSLRSAIQGAAANTFSAFPSGHCGLSWLVPIFAHRMGYRTYRLLTIIAAVLITSATLVMRYHYFADFLFSLLIVYFSAWFGGFHTQQCYDQSVRGDEQDMAKDQKGRRYEGLQEDSEDDGETGARVPLMEVTVDRGSNSPPSAGPRDEAAPNGTTAGQTAGTGGMNGGNGVMSPMKAAGMGEGKREGGGSGPSRGLLDAAHEEDGESSDGGMAAVPAQPRMPRVTTGEMTRLTSSGAINRQSTGDHSKLATTRE